MLNEAIIQDQRRDTPTSLQLIQCLAHIPMAPLTLFQKMAGDKRPVVRDAAIRALGWLDDSPAALDALTAALAGESDRIAMYALRRILLFTPAAEACRRLQAMPLSKVTVAKEVVRLLGEFTTEAALQALQAFAQQSLHRDVRIALLRALWSHLERKEAWVLIDEAAASPEAAVVSGLTRIPDDRLSSSARTRLLTLLILLLEHPEAAVRVDVLQRCVNLPCRDPERLLLSAVIQRLHSQLPDERNLAATAAATICLPRDADMISGTVRDHRTNRRMLAALCFSLLAMAPHALRRLLPVARAILKVLEQDPLCVRLRVQLVGAYLSPMEFAGWLVQHISELHAETLPVIAQVVESPRFLQAGVQQLEAIEQQLTSDQDERLRRVALTALAAQCRLQGSWDEARLARLNRFRGDPSALVAEVAQFTLPLEEESGVDDRFVSAQ